MDNASTNCRGVGELGIKINGGKGNIRFTQLIENRQMVAQFFDQECTTNTDNKHVTKRVLLL